MLLLAVHASGLGWDELAVLLGGLTAVTGALIMLTRTHKPVPVEIPEVALQAPTPGRARRRRR